MLGLVPDWAMTSHNLSLLDTENEPLILADGVFLFRRFMNTAPLLKEIERLAFVAAFRHMTVPGGAAMSVAMTNCGPFGWTASTRGYAYSAHDPLTGEPWPAMPEIFSALAQRVANAAGFQHFAPDACLINRYAVGARMGLHQDKDERDLDAPIVSVSIGASATFLLGGLTRKEKVARIEIHDGDVVVWGGASRLRYHGVAPLKTDVAAPLRFNLTLRKAI
jgi:DNA oxidative demethylase